MRYNVTARHLVQFLFIVYVLLLIVELSYNFAMTISEDPRTSFCTFNISDWLINYEGGFVRRGIIGQIIWECYRHIPFDILGFINIFTLICTIVLAIVTTYCFYKYKVSWILLPTILMFGNFATTDITWFRRDALMLLLILLIFYLYRKYVTACSNRSMWYIAFSLIGIFLILMHEASFFCFVPLIMVHYFFYRNKSLLKRAVNTLFIALPLIVAMGLVCLYRGDIETGNKIWESWQPYMLEHFGTILPLGKGQEALGWDTKMTFYIHYDLNYLSQAKIDNFLQPLNISLYNAPLWIIIYMAVYYLCINVNRVQLFDYENCDKNNTIYTSLQQVIVIQFIALIPLFTVLSCDLKRIVTYWVFSTFFFCFQLKHIKQPLHIAYFTPICQSVAQWVKNSKPFNSRLFFFTILLVLAIPYAGYYLSDLFSTSVAANACHVIGSIIIPAISNWF